MKTEIIFPTIERWHCIDLVLENIRQAEKPDDIQVLIIASGSEKYKKYVEKKFKEIFKKVRVVRNKETGIEHDKLRKIQYENLWEPDLKISVEKMHKVYRTYQLAKDNIDKTADYFWFIEDDTLFPLRTYSHYRNLMDILQADIISGQSYYWHTLDKIKRNFWKLLISKDNEVALKEFDGFISDEGIVRLGATGLGNVLATNRAVKTWQPMSLINLKSGADISFFLNAQVRGFPAYGIYNIYLPHITKYQNGDIEIRGRIDKSIIPLVNKFYDARRNP